jgi:hypothetical protein
VRSRPPEPRAANLPPEGDLARFARPHDHLRGGRGPQETDQRQREREEAAARRPDRPVERGERLPFQPRLATGATTDPFGTAFATRRE